MGKHIEILGYDEVMQSVFINGVSGSITLDIIPDAICFMKSNPECPRAYLNDYTGTSILLHQDSTIESAVRDWQMARDLRNGVHPFAAPTAKPQTYEAQGPQM